VLTVIASNPAWRETLHPWRETSTHGEKPPSIERNLHPMERNPIHGEKPSNPEKKYGAEFSIPWPVRLPRA
jgi:hypothetical protein